jgi:hypothetical protein
LDQRNEGTSKIGDLTTAAIYDGSSGEDDAAVVTDNLDGFLNAAAAGDDVFRNDECFARLDLESSAQNESAVAVFFHKNMLFPKMARDFLAHNNAADSWGYDGRCWIGAEFIREQSTDLRGDGSILQEQGALEKLTAMESAAKDKMPIQQGAGFSKEFKNVAHGLAEIIFCFC